MSRWALLLKRVIFCGVDIIVGSALSYTVVANMQSVSILLNEPESPPLFPATKIKKHEYWQFIRLVAPSREERIWTTKDAVAAWCTKCRARITFSSGNIHGVQRHMDKYHGADVVEFLSKNLEEVKKQKAQTDLRSFFSPAPAISAEPATKTEQLYGELLVVDWIGSSVRPFSDVEDKGLRQLIEFACLLQRQFQMPSRFKVRRQLIRVVGALMVKVTKTIASEMLYYALTSDIWTSLAMESFISLTIHYLTDGFEMREFTLKVSKLEGRHTGDLIKATLSTALIDFGIDKCNMSMMLRDNGSNMVKACNDWRVTSFGCVGHSLHLVVGPLLLEPRPKRKLQAHNQPTVGAKRARESVDDTEEKSEDQMHDEEVDDDEDADDIADYDDDFDASVLQDLKVSKVRKIVGEFRAVAKYVKYSVIAKEKLAELDLAQRKIQRQFDDVEAVLTPEKISIMLDVKTRWNSAYAMLVHLVKLKRVLNDFLEYQTNKTGQSEFVRKNPLPVLSERKWAVIEGLCILLKPFQSVTQYLSGQKYSTFVHVLPKLRNLKDFLQRQARFKVSEHESRAPSVSAFIQGYADKWYLSDVLDLLDSCRSSLASSFQARFTNMSIDVMWTTILDPRFRTLKHLSRGEVESAKALLHNEVLSLASRHHQLDAAVPSAPAAPRCQSEDDLMFDSPAKPTRFSTDELSIRHAVEREILTYLDPAMIVESDVNPLEWWATFKKQFPFVAVAARKWLAVCASSTPSERVFSDCGLALTAKRSRLDGAALECQVLYKRNRKAAAFDLADVQNIISIM